MSEFISSYKLEFINDKLSAIDDHGLEKAILYIIKIESEKKHKTIISNVYETSTLIDIASLDEKIVDKIIALISEYARCINAKRHLK